MKMAIFVIFFFCLVMVSLQIDVLAVPKITIQTLPQEVYKNEEFSIRFNITNDSPNSDIYYMKGRIGSSSASLNQGETFNFIFNSWLSDTSSWSSFPAVIFFDNSIASASLTLRTKPTVMSGINLITIRLNKNSISYDSSPSALLVLDPLPTVTPTSTPMPEAITNESYDENIPLTIIPTSTPTLKPTPTPKNSTKKIIVKIITSTPTPSSSSEEKVLISPVIIYRYSNTNKQNNIYDNQVGKAPYNKEEGQVLGFSSMHTTINKSYKPFIKSLSFASLSYSLLTIFSILLKIKKEYGKSNIFYSSSLYSKRNQ